jgi:hypothetical protein
VVYLPDTGAPYPTLPVFFAGRFPKIPPQVWLERLASGKVVTEEGLAVTPQTA